MEVKPGIYKHYKGNLYRVIALCKHTETLENFVAYEALYENETSRYWVRPLSMFLENVEVDREMVPRFEYVAE